ncbi:MULTISPECIES: hypothetical protein [Photobacterium]|uniref:Uncharacterized protein n=1 Tax=Photobacterium damselae TaxID=38293 RepID=A0A2T3Q8B9_PHODM|nr:MULTISPECIES: hypothetical protein [Photobacterium]MCD9524776.1 hypothetical protein [Photobacterium carnosum]PSW80264.1 hypothetical protein CTN07_20140 [Photobacterium damselae]UKA31776.1 hypothetical protein IPQ37_21125 [Photobacterium damselae subsp. damselae]SPY46027.1 Uncharacterised protein [Photobacterium damselae]
MEDKTFTVELKCLFCDCVLEGDTDKELSSGDMIECQSCHEFNDYDAVIDVASEEGRALVLEYSKKEIKKALGKFFK